MAEKSAHCLETPVGRGLSSILTSWKESGGAAVAIHCPGPDLGPFSPKWVESVEAIGKTTCHAVFVVGEQRFAGASKGIPNLIALEHQRKSTRNSSDVFLQEEADRWYSWKTLATFFWLLGSSKRSGCIQT